MVVSRIFRGQLSLRGTFGDVAHIYSFKDINVSICELIAHLIPT